MKYREIIDQAWFAGIERPSRYLGNEVNTVGKFSGTIELTFGLAFPDVYEVGMSHQGLKILYEILNHYDWLAAEMVFCPWVDMEQALRERCIPLQTQETGIPIGQLDILGFSLQHELCFSNVLTMLELGGIPFLASERDETSPLVIAGGPACFNPEPVAEVFDLILVGDGEEACPEICHRVRQARKDPGVSKEDLLEVLSHIQGVYIPSFFRTEYEDSGEVKQIRSLRRGTGYVRKAVVPDLDKAPFPSKQVVPYSNPVHDRLSVEICRGCTRGCRFCQAGMIYRPVRERALKTVLGHVEKGLEQTGYEEVSLLSLSSGDYSGIGGLLTQLMDRLSKEKTAVSLPSLRIDSLEEAWFEQIKRVRKTGFTLAPEAGSDRLRRVINKTLTNEEIIEAAEKVYKAGWRLIKLYFMVGLPGETQEDIQEIIRLSRNVARKAGGHGKKPVLHVSVAAFVPKPHTPFMWSPQIALDESKRRIETIRKALHEPRIRVKWNSPEMSWMEGIFSRGDRRLLNALIRAWKNGARFDAWGEHFNLEVWKQAFAETSIQPEFYLHRERGKEEIMPWEHIRSGVKKDYLYRELRLSREEKTSPDCRLQCLECGVCDHDEIDPVVQGDPSPMDETTGFAKERSFSDAKIFALTFSKTESARYLGHLELVRVFTRALRRAGISVSHTKGFHPSPKISFASALPVGTESLAESVRIELTNPMASDLLKESLNKNLPSGIEILHAGELGAKKKDRLAETHFRIRLPDAWVDKAAIDKFLASEERIVKKITGKGEREVDARKLVKGLDLAGRGALELILFHPPGASLKPADILREVLALDKYQVQALRILKFKQVMG